MIVRFLEHSEFCKTSNIHAISVVVKGPKLTQIRLLEHNFGDDTSLFVG